MRKTPETVPARRTRSTYQSPPSAMIRAAVSREKSMRRVVELVWAPLSSVPTMRATRLLRGV
jgi:hypothetical protein